MDITAIAALVVKGVNIASALIAAGQSAAPAFQALENLFKSKETITQADMDATDSILDGLLNDFNSDLPAA